MSDLETLSPAVFYGLCKYRFGHWRSEDIANYQRRKLAETVKFAVSHSPFYKKHYQGRDINNFTSLPPVNKQLMMDNFSDFNTLNLNKTELINFALNVESNRDFSARFNGLAVGMSSGTSGNKGLIVTTRREELYLKAMYFSRLILPRQKLTCAFILRVSSPAFKFKFLGNSLTHINQLQPTEQIVSQIEKIRPNVISAPPSMLKILAIEKQFGRLHVHPALVYSYAEVLYPEDKLYLSEVFACPVYQIYQGSEGCYALTCKKGNLHVNEDIVYFELLNEDGSSTPPGNPCYRLLVTDLHKRSQPIIRFELNDIITLSPKLCSCGSSFRVITNIQGRADQLFWGLRLKSGRKQFIYPDYIARKIISVSDAITDYQAIQNDYTQVTVRLELKPSADSDLITNLIKQGIKDIFKAYDCKLPVVTIEFGRPVVNPQSNKLIRIIGNIKPD